MNNFETINKIKSLMRAEKSLLTFNERFRAETDKQSCDKFGAGFNEDSRFSAFSVKVSFDSWVGYYGNSSCSTFGPYTAADNSKYFIKAINKNRDLIFEAMADLIKHDYTTMLSEAKNELQKANDLINSIESDRE